jgi:hypothetical protein
MLSPNAEPIGFRYIAKPIPSMIQISAGIPSTFQLDSSSQIHTTKPSQTLEYFRPYASVHLAWGSATNGDAHPILNENNRSLVKTSWKSGTGDGSYNLSSMVVPPIQAKSPIASSRILSVLQVLYERRQLRSRYISNFQTEIMDLDFRPDWNNVSSMQTNISSLGMHLEIPIGTSQGARHYDQFDDELVYVNPPGLFALHAFSDGGESEK